MLTRDDFNKEFKFILMGFYNIYKTKIGKEKYTHDLMKKILYFEDKDLLTLQFSNTSFHNIKKNVLKEFLDNKHLLKLRFDLDNSEKGIKKLF